MAFIPDRSAAGICRDIRALLPKWRTWFPNERSEAEIPRCDLLTLVEAAEEHARYAAELDKAAAIIQRVHPIGEVKAIGRLEVVAGLSELFPADDGEPTDEAWMYSHDLQLDPGWGFRVCGVYGNGVYIVNSRAGWKAHTVGLFEDLDEVTVELALLPTRGDVRRLLSAFKPK